MNYGPSLADLYLNMGNNKSVTPDNIVIRNKSPVVDMVTMVTYLSGYWLIKT